MTRKIHQTLLDLQKELCNTLLSDKVTVRNKVYEMRLLTEQENSYVFGLVRSNNTIELALSARLANLSVGIRSIDGVPISDLFEETYKALSPEEMAMFNEDNINLIYARMFYDYLKELPPDFIGELAEHWNTLETRRQEAQKEIKNS